MKPYLIAILVFTLCNFGFSQNAIKKIKISDDIELMKISKNAYIYTSYVTIPRYGRFPSNGLLFVNNQQAFLFDTPMTDSLTMSLVRWIADSMHIRIVGFVANHWHNDCIGGLDYIHSLGIESYSSELTREIARAKKLPVPRHGFKDSLVLKLGEKEIICKYFGAGHTRDNIVSWIPSENILFGGCMIRDTNATGLGNIDDADLQEWPKTVKKVLSNFGNANIVIPGHGQFGNAQLITHTLELLHKPH